MAISLGGISSTVISDGAYNAFPGIVRLPNGTLMVIYRAGANHNTAQDGVIKSQISTDGGATWAAAQTIYDPPTATHDARDVEVTLLANGTLLLSFFVAIAGANQKVYVLIGTITGSSVAWGDPILACDDFTTFTACSGKPLQLANGTILLPVYGKNTADTFEHAAVVSSTDNGLTWSAPVTVASAVSTIAYNEWGMVQLGSGRVVGIVRNSTLRGYAEVHSDNNGATWSSPVNVINIGSTSTGGRPTLLILQSGDLFLFTRKGIPFTSAYAVSEDDGVTWTPFIKYGPRSTIEHSFEYGSAILLPDGTIGAVIGRESDGVGSVFSDGTAAYITYQNFRETATYPIIDKITSHWSLEEASGTRVDDIADNDLTDTNTVTQAAGKVGNAALLTSANSKRLTSADKDVLSVGDQNATWFGWAMMNSKPGVTVFIASKWQSVSANQREYNFGWQVTTDRFIAQMSADGVSGTTIVVANSLGAPSTGVWYFIVVTYDSVNDLLGIQINNGTVDTTAHSGGGFNGTGLFGLGALMSTTPGNHWDGRLDQWGYCRGWLLSAEERTWLYNNNNGRSFAEIQAGMPSLGAGITDITNITRII
jgi:hypothetical protein